MSADSITMTLPQVIDIALHCPEHGAVNFNMLHTLLHVLIQQLQLGQCQVEFRGRDGERIKNLMSMKGDSTIKITEYVVSPPKDAGKVVQRKPPASKDSTTADEEILDMSKVGSQDSLQTVVVVEQNTKPEDTYEPYILSQKYISDLRQEVTEVKHKLQELTDLPGNATLIEALRGAGIEKASPVLDMFQTLSMAKKIDAAETGLTKLASIVEDLAKQSGIQGLENILQGERTTCITDFETFIERTVKLGSDNSFCIVRPDCVMPLVMAKCRNYGKSIVLGKSACIENIKKKHKLAFFVS